MTTENPSRITILAKSFSAAAVEFHRSNMAERGYQLESRIEPTKVQLVDEETGQPKDLFDGEVMFSVSFVKK